MARQLSRKEEKAPARSVSDAPTGEVDSSIDDGHKPSKHNQVVLGEAEPVTTAEPGPAPTETENETEIEAGTEASMSPGSKGLLSRFTENFNFVGTGSSAKAEAVEEKK